MIKSIYKYPRLYINSNIKENTNISLNTEQAHYLNNVLRKKENDLLRLFDGKNGEWLASINSLNKKSCKTTIERQIKEQPSTKHKINLFFSPIKKKRLNILIEKAVELGVTDLYPILTNRTENRKVNYERTISQIIEATEQCERLNIPRLHHMQSLSDTLSKPYDPQINICLERYEKSKSISSYSYDQGASFMIGAEGGFDDSEVKMILNSENTNIITLGDPILRTETAAISCLSYVKLSLL